MVSGPAVDLCRLERCLPVRCRSPLPWSLADRAASPWRRCRSPICCATSTAASSPMSSSTATRSTFTLADGTDVPDERASQLRHRERRVRCRPGEEARAHRRPDARPSRPPTATARWSLGLGFIGMLGLTLYRVTTGRIPALESKTREADPDTIDDHLRRRRRRRRGEGRSEGDRRLPARAGAVLGDRRAHPERRAARRPAGHRQDAAGALDRRRGEGAVPLRERLGLRRDVRRRRRVAHPQAVQGRAPPSARASSSSTSSTRSAAAAAATRSATKSASRR